MPRLLLATFLTLAALLAPPPAWAQAEAVTQPAEPGLPEQRASAIVAVLRGEQAADAVFTPAFLAAVPPPQLAALLAGIEAEHGPLEGVGAIIAQATPHRATVELRFAHSIGRAVMELETVPPHLVAGLRITGFVPRNDAGESVARLVAALPGEASLLLTPLDGGPPALAHRPSAPMAIASTFKLYVLSALLRAIEAGRHRWDEVVPLSQRSFPSGMLQDWPAGAPVTVHTLATLMIAISDNTATDALMALLGRAAVEAELALAGHANPQATLPLLTTRELFLLKTREDAVLERYLAAGLAERRAMLAALAGAQTSTEAIDSLFAAGPRAIGIEWFASAEDIARLYARLAASPEARAILAINPGFGPGMAEGWAYVGYKGGSEPGVLNLSWLLTDEGGRDWVLVLGWNDPAAPVNEPRLLGLAAAALAELEAVAH